jgi:hypothetical protein
VATASLAFLMLSGFMTFVGLVPCFGWVNWTAVPMSMLTIMVGLIGLATDRDEVTRQPRGIPTHAAAIAIGMMLVVVGAVRCLVGLGIL